mmetsp:Transcript_347/g.338  ORF Transcript_347/g.338 Transcript_347/m.338 type:complete len:287 (+) Transcript_347:118-978(+)|eukprot:CAMPEP_0182417000 /NCGR_PEP_ID=MMETSP1167-20130531/1435_1 /TAXON_ID=2988 /ORGANISM="Mallomonas Sp, Strain CCMP3275" /LENGTH=286 /DNA_ID=CAMNT_0024590255 /DNA_START=45 /DNA_END=905 /DNA_ORIENTATION=+
MADENIDKDLNSLLNKLNRIQKDVGGKKKNNILGDDGKVDQFLDIKSGMMERLQNIREQMELVQGQDRSGAHAKDVIIAQNTIRAELNELNDEWQQMDSLYRTEARKRKSKYSPDELRTRQLILQQLQQEIQSIKDFQKAGFIKGYQAYTMSNMEDSELFRGGDGASSGVVSSTGKQQEMTDQNRLALQMIKEKDNQIDDEIEKIGVGIGELGELARAQRDEVKLQNQMLTSLETKVDGVHDHIANVNVRMKDTLEQARQSDKLCVDIICILILLGMIIVLVKITI